MAQSEIRMKMLSATLELRESESCLHKCSGSLRIFVQWVEVKDLMV